MRDSELARRVEAFGLGPTREPNTFPALEPRQALPQRRPAQWLPDNQNRSMPRAANVGPSGDSAQPDIRRLYPSFFNNIYTLRQEMEQFTDAVLNYYLNDMTKLDSRNTPGQYGNASVLREIMARDKRDEELGLQRPVWKMTKTLGSGGYGQVTLWTREGADGETRQLAVKDMKFAPFFNDYNNEGNLLRRLNELNNCINIVGVVEWILMPEDKIRMAFEFCDLGDLFDVYDFYWKHQLFFPEHFLWHVFHSIATAICFCARGTLDPEPRTDWEEIVHCDIKPSNILLCSPPPGQVYPTLKLGDFGLAYTIPNEEVRQFKAAYRPAGTKGYKAPEMTRQRTGKGYAHMLPGSYSDVYSLGATMGRLMYLGGRRMGRQWREAFLQTKPHGHIYTSELVQLMYECLQSDGRRRPAPYELMCRTRSAWQSWESRLQRSMQRVDLNRSPNAIYYGKVLFRSDEQRTDGSVFAAYKRANDAESRMWNERMGHQNVWESASQPWNIGDLDQDPLEVVVNPADAAGPRQAQPREAKEVRRDQHAREQQAREQQAREQQAREQQAREPRRPAQQFQPAQVAPWDPPRQQVQQVQQPQQAQQVRHVQQVQPLQPTHQPQRPPILAQQYQPYRPGHAQLAPRPRPYRPGHYQQAVTPGQPAVNPAYNPPQPYQQDRIQQADVPRQPATNPANDRLPPPRPVHEQQAGFATQPVPAARQLRPLPRPRLQAVNFSKPFPQEPDTPGPAAEQPGPLRAEQAALTGNADPEGPLAKDLFTQPRQFVDFAQLDTEVKGAPSPSKRRFAEFAQPELAEERKRKLPRLRKRLGQRMRQQRGSTSLAPQPQPRQQQREQERQTRTGPERQPSWFDRMFSGGAV